MMTRTLGLHHVAISNGSAVNTAVGKAIYRAGALFMGLRQGFLN